MSKRYREEPYHNNNNLEKKITNKGDLLNKIVIHDKFYDVLDDLNKFNIKLPDFPISDNLNLENTAFPNNGELVINVDEIKPYNLDANQGEKMINQGWPIAAYDESINKYSALEGEAYLTSHSLVLISNEYIPMNLLTLYFYTRAKKLSDNTNNIKYSDKPSAKSKNDYVQDKINFLIKFTPKNSILLIDGPLIGGDYYTHMIRAIEDFFSKNITPVFFVKNSESNLVTNHIYDLSNNFNSDMHWAFNFLKPGQRTNFFKYEDRINKANAKIFCYLKGFNSSPQRIEIHVNTYEKNKNFVENLMNLIYYFLLVQGSIRNPQVRPISIAEAYAREALKLINLHKLMKTAGLIPTINEGRGFAW
jgi:hypothetical protein